MENKHALLVGGSGLIGKHLCQLLAQDPEFETVTSLVRKTSKDVEKKINEVQVNFNDLSQIALKYPPTHAFCCLGTTMKKAGSKAAFYKVDYEFVIAFAQMALSAGAKNFSVVTAMGADSKSLFYYNRVKGEIEATLNKFGFESLHIFRPSLLLGNRNETRFGENIGKLLSSIFNPIIPADYKGIEGKQVAKGMWVQAKKTAKGKFINTSGEIQRM